MAEGARAERVSAKVAPPGGCGQWTQSQAPPSPTVLQTKRMNACGRLSEAPTLQMEEGAEREQVFEEGQGRDPASLQMLPSACTPRLRYRATWDRREGRREGVGGTQGCPFPAWWDWRRTLLRTGKRHRTLRCPLAPDITKS